MVLAGLLPTLDSHEKKELLLHLTLAGGFQAGAGLPRCRFGEEGFDPPAPVFNLSKAGKEREGVGVVQRVAEGVGVVFAAEGMQGEEGL